jgi:hypothetical protein
VRQKSSEPFRTKQKPRRQNKFTVKPGLAVNFVVKAESANFFKKSSQRNCSSSKAWSAKFLLKQSKETALLLKPGRLDISSKAGTAINSSKAESARQIRQ